MGTRNPQATVLLYAHPHTFLPGNTTLRAVDELMLCRGLRRWNNKAALVHPARSGQTVRLPVCRSARALVKKTQEPGIKLQKADFFRNDTWTSPQANSEEAPKIPLVHFFNSRWPPPCNVIFEKEGYTLIPHLCS